MLYITFFFSGKESIAYDPLCFLNSLQFHGKRVRSYPLTGDMTQMLTTERTPLKVCKDQAVSKKKYARARQ